MKNASSILNVVLLIAVAVLFYLHFFLAKKSEPVKIASGVTSSVPTGDFRIAYFEMDSINNSYAKVKDVKKELSKEEERINNELTSLQKTYNDRIIQYQSQPKNNMTSVESEKANRDILQLQDRIRSKKQELDQKFQDLYMRKMQEVKVQVEDYLKEYNKAKGYSYILAYEPGFIFYRDSAYNITDDLVKGLNERYRKK